MTVPTNAAAAGEASTQVYAADANAMLATDLARSLATETDAWRREVADRLARYRNRRKPRAPRYPSLMLLFDSPENWMGSVAISSPSGPESNPATDMTPRERTSLEPYLAKTQDAVEPSVASELSTNVIEFPRSAAIPIFHSNSLADPILEKPRIVEAPEVVPPPPALGGILIEAEQNESADRHGSDSPPAVASVLRRIAAAVIDGGIVLFALAAFGAIFLRFNPVPTPMPILSIAGVSFAILLWMAYEFSFLVCTGSTPGMRATRIRLVSFDGLPVDRRTRRWRVLASFLSGFSAGLGYLWCFLDQDSLGWHDRITRTHLRSV
jgi:uncharacterized RDD family membrane protein YckC